jgi:hypothetical protein
VPANSNDYEVLIDGLQRFSIGTALLHILHRFVLSAGARFPNEKQHYLGLAARAMNLAPIYENNHAELADMPEKPSARVISTSSRPWPIGSKTSQARVRQGPCGPYTILLLERQFAPDTYHGFQSEYEVTSTFIG